jgi:hypothetical protein
LLRRLLRPRQRIHAKRRQLAVLVRRNVSDATVRQSHGHELRLLLDGLCGLLLMLGTRNRRLFHGRRLFIREAVNLGQRKAVCLVLLDHFFKARTLVLFRNAGADIGLWVLSRMVLAVLHQRAVVEA